MTVARFGRVSKLYVVNGGADDIDMLLVHCLLHPFDYQLVRAMCGDSEVDVHVGYHEECLDMLEYRVARSWHTRKLDYVLDDVYYAATNERVDASKLLFVVETEDGEYVVFDVEALRNIARLEMLEDLEMLKEELEELRKVAGGYD